MSDSKKLFTAREAAQAVLAKAKQILEDSSLAKSERLKKDGTLGSAIGYPGSPPPAPPVNKSEMKKYETENKKAPSKAKELPSQKLERDYKNFETQKESPNSSGDDKRQEKQVSPSGNPKEEAEGNNKPDGMEPEFEFKNKVEKELAKEKASHMVKSQSGMHTVMYQSMKKSENPDEKEDAELGEQVEHDVEEHHKDMGNEVDEEGHDMAKPEDKAEGQTERASIPMCIGSAKLSKFMEYKHSKRKAAQGAQSQAPAAVGQDASNAPQAGSTQAGQPDQSRPKTQPMDGDVNKMGKAESSFDKLKHKIENKEGYSEKGAAGAAYEAGVKKYGKAGMAAKAAAGRKK
jgi:hypothetical protein